MDGIARPAFSCLALARYEGRAREVIIKWKHAHSAQLDAALSAVWASALPPRPQFAHSPPGGNARRSLCVVPAPSRWQRRRDGRLVAAVLGCVAAREWGVSCLDAMRIRPVFQLYSGSLLRELAQKFRVWCAGQIGVGYQVANFAARERKRAGIYARERLDGLQVVIVDDVVTTGATISAVANAVRAAGGEVIGALALAAPSPPQLRSNTVTRKWLSE